MLRWKSWNFNKCALNVRLDLVFVCASVYLWMRSIKVQLKPHKQRADALTASSYWAERHRVLFSRSTFPLVDHASAATTLQYCFAFFVLMLFSTFACRMFQYLKSLERMFQSNLCNCVVLHTIHKLMPPLFSKWHLPTNSVNADCLSVCMWNAYLAFI